jgi:outer membrane protein assembly factor BamB
MSTGEKTTAANSITPSQAWFTWAAAIVIGFVLWTVVRVASVLVSVDSETWTRLYTGLDSLRWLIGGVLLGVIAFVYWAYWVRLSRRKVVALLVILLAVGVVSGNLFRFEGTYGNLFPRVVWRWSPSADGQWTAYAAHRDVSPDAKPLDESAISLAPTEHDFPAFLGPTRDGNITNIRLARDWHRRPPRELWRHPIGLGWGSFAVVGDFAFTQEQRGDVETVVCYELKTGRERWAYGQSVRFSASHGDGPRATPTIVDGRVYVIGATGLLTCLDGATGTAIWQQQALSDPVNQNLVWGMSGSPLVVGDVVIVTPGGGPGRSVVAYRCEDGSFLWSGGDDMAGYASPMLRDFAGRPQILNFNGEGLRGHDAADGAPLWLHPWITHGSSRVNIAQPLVVTPFGQPAVNEGFVLISSGYGVGAALVRVTAIGGDWRIEEVWRTKDLESKLSNFVVHEDHIYGLDNGVLVCIDLRDGRRAWKRGRHGHGQLLLVDDLILLQAESGAIALIEATPEEHRELARLPALSDKTWNHPTLAGDVLVVRNDREAAAFELPLAE